MVRKPVRRTGPILPWLAPRKKDRGERPVRGNVANKKCHREGPGRVGMDRKKGDVAQSCQKTGKKIKKTSTVEESQETSKGLHLTRNENINLPGRRVPGGKDKKAKGDTGSKSEWNNVGKDLLSEGETPSSGGNGR